MLKIITLFLTVSLAGCLSSPAERYVYPPAAFLDDCPITYADRTQHGVIETLADAVWCERAGKRAARCWIESHQGADSSPECRNPVPCEGNRTAEGDGNVGNDTDRGGDSCLSDDGAAPDRRVLRQPTGGQA